ncbi:MAG: TolC family protein [Archangium sp.]|nr:TolC family protein [Archangium sp.]
MRAFRPPAALALIISGSVAHAGDGHLAVLIADALDARPELAQARADVQAAQERVPQAESWPDPMLQFGVQNDSFNKWQVGKMETSWLSFMATQTIPFPGKPRLRAEITAVDVTVRRLAVERVRLSTVAEVHRTYLALQLTRARLELLSRLSSLLVQAVEAAQARYESGDGPQSDILRARLEVARLEQQRVVLLADEQLRIAGMNRLRGRALDEKVTSLPMTQLSFPPAPDLADALKQSFATSPEYRVAEAFVGGAERTRELGQRQYFPDLSVGAGVMVRGGLDPMWTVTLGVPLPVFAATKQSRAVAEADATIEASERGVEAVAQVLRLRTSERVMYWRALGEVWNTYQTRLLTDAEATAAATLTQYRVGKVPLAAVLEATSATISVLDASNGVLIDAWRLRVAQDEASLSEISTNGGSMSSSIPGTGAARSTGRPTTSPGTGATSGSTGM